MEKSKKLFTVEKSRKLHCGEKQDKARHCCTGDDTVTFRYLDADIGADHHK